MTKQILFIAVTISAAAFFSCSKDKGFIDKSNTVSTEEKNSVSKEALIINYDPLTYKLEGSFQFDGNLKDATRKLYDGLTIPTTRPAYTADRKGNLNSALSLNGGYYVSLPHVPQQVNTSLSVWVKRSAYYTAAEVIFPTDRGLGINQQGYAFQGYVNTSANTAYANSPNYNDQAWHHLVVTYDGTNFKLYVDGTLKVTNYYPAALPSEEIYYALGWMSHGGYWKGAIDDLRFYSRTLTSTDVQSLYNL